MFSTACHQYTSTEDSSSILQLPVSGSIQRSLNAYLESHVLSDRNEFFCNICSSNNQALADQDISEVGDYLIIQVKRFLVFNQAVTKDVSKISCTPTVAVPVTLDEDIVDHNKFNLFATINHSGNLARGRYTSFLKSASSSSSSSSWFHCNDAAVIPSNETALNNDTSYTFSYKNMSWEYEKIGRGELWVDRCWSLQEFCIPALSIAGIVLTCVLTWIFKGTNHHWWPFWTSSDVALLVTQGFLFFFYNNEVPQK